eukprot:2924643-Pleurochrysis_carterae.AAC.2
MTLVVPNTVDFLFFAKQMCFSVCALAVQARASERLKNARVSSRSAALCQRDNSPASQQEPNL